MNTVNLRRYTFLFFLTIGLTSCMPDTEVSDTLELSPPKIISSTYTTSYTWSGYSENYSKSPILITAQVDFTEALYQAKSFKLKVNVHFHSSCLFPFSGLSFSSTEMKSLDGANSSLSDILPFDAIKTLTNSSEDSPSCIIKITYSNDTGSTNGPYIYNFPSIQLSESNKEQT